MEVKDNAINCLTWNVPHNIQTKEIPDLLVVDIEETFVAVSAQYIHPTPEASIKEVVDEETEISVATIKTITVEMLIEAVMGALQVLIE